MAKRNTNTNTPKAEVKPEQAKPEVDHIDESKVEVPEIIDGIDYTMVEVNALVPVEEINFGQNCRYNLGVADMIGTLTQDRQIQNALWVRRLADGTLVLIKGNRRLSATLKIREINPELFNALCPDGKIRVNIIECDDYAASLLIHDHGADRPLSMQEVRKSIRDMRATGVTEKEVAFRLRSIFDRVQPIKRDKREDLEKLWEEYTSAKPGTPSQYAALASFKDKYLAYRKGLIQNAMYPAKLPVIVEAAIRFFESGEIEEGFTRDDFPLQPFNTTVEKDLAKAFADDCSENRDITRHNYGDATRFWELWNKLLVPSTNNGDNGPKRMTKPEIEESRKDTKSQGMKLMLDKVLGLDVPNPALTKADDDLQRVEAIRADDPEFYAEFVKRADALIIAARSGNKAAGKADATAS